MNDPFTRHLPIDPREEAQALIARRNQIVETHVLMLCRMHNLNPNEKVSVATFQGRPVHKTLAETMKPAARKQMAEQGWPAEDATTKLLSMSVDAEKLAGDLKVARAKLL